jgi:hypothetical protein
MDLVGALGDGRSGGNGRAGLAARPDKQEYSIQFGSHPENLGYVVPNRGPCGRMSATQDDKTWFVLLKGKRYGPLTFASVLRAVERGVIDTGAWVWCLGWDEWRIAREVPGLFEQELVPAPDHQEEDVDSPDEEDDRDEDDDRDELGESGEDTSEKAAPDASATSEPLVGRNARIVILSILTVLVIVAGAGWTAISLGIIRVKFMF